MGEWKISLPGRPKFSLEKYLCHSTPNFIGHFYLRYAVG
jgi:hypothetical protein